MKMKGTLHLECKTDYTGPFYKPQRDEISVEYRAPLISQATAWRNIGRKQCAIDFTCHSVAKYW